MLGEALVSRTVAFDDFAFALLDLYDDAVPAARGGVRKGTVQAGPVVSVADTVGIGVGGKRFPHTEEVNGFEEVRLAGTVLADEAIEARAKLEGLARVVFELG